MSTRTAKTNTMTAAEAVQLAISQRIDDAEAEAALIIRHRLDLDEYIAATRKAHPHVEAGFIKELREAHARQVAFEVEDLGTGGNVW